MTCTPADPDCARCGLFKGNHTATLGCPHHPDKSFRRRVVDMPRFGVAPFPDVPLGVCRHHKGGMYMVIGGIFAAAGEGDVVEVLYTCVVDGYLGHRPHDDFLAEVVDAVGKPSPRFTRVH